MKYKLPAGSYYIGDPCYILDSDTYDWFLEYTDFFQDVEKMVSDDAPLLILPTYYGDGVYEDQTTFKYEVDSGTLACIPESLVIKDEVFERKLSRGDFKEVYFNSDFYCEDYEGFLKFGHVEIDTSPEEEDEIEEDWPEDWPEDWRDPYEVILDTFEGW